MPQEIDPDELERKLAEIRKEKKKEESEEALRKENEDLKGKVQKLTLEDYHNKANLEQLVYQLLTLQEERVQHLGNAISYLEKAVEVRGDAGDYGTLGYTQLRMGEENPENEEKIRYSMRAVKNLRKMCDLESGLPGNEILLAKAVLQTRRALKLKCPRIKGDIKIFEALLDPNSSFTKACYDLGIRLITMAEKKEGDERKLFYETARACFQTTYEAKESGDDKDDKKQLEYVESALKKIG